MRFNYNMPVQLIFGAGKVAEVGTELAKYGKKVLLVTGTGSTKRTGLLDRVLNIIKETGLEVVVFDKVQQNPLTTTAEEGAKIAIENNCDVVLGLGGGSILDAAKGIAFLAKNDGDISDYIYGIKFSEKALPLVLVPTTAGTGSEGNHFAVLTNPVTKDKKSLRTAAIYAKSSIIDPELMVTMPQSIVASVGFDALCHNIETYIAKNGTPISDVQSLYAISLLKDNLLKVYHDPSDVKSWESVSLASTLGGMGIGVAGVTAAHGLEHPASGLKDIVHGKGLAAITPVVLEMSYSKDNEKFEILSKALGGTKGSQLPDLVRNLLKELNLLTTLGELGIKSEDVPWMTENSFKISSPSIQNHPVVFSAEEITKIYELSL